MQIDAIRLWPFYRTQPNDNNKLQPESRQQLPKASTDQEEPVDLKNVLTSHTTLSQLLDADLSSGASVKKVSVDKPESKTDNEDLHALPEDVLRQTRINNLAVHILIYERDRRNAARQQAVESGLYKAAADETVDNLLKNMNAFLQNAELTSEQLKALEVFNLMVNQAKNNFDPFYYDEELNVHGYSADGLFADLESAFGILAESFNSVEGTMSVSKDTLEAIFTDQMDQLKSSLKESLGVPDLTEEDILGILTKYIKTYAATEEQAIEDQQLAQNSMPEIIEAIKKFDPEFHIAAESI